MKKNERSSTTRFIFYFCKAIAYAASTKARNSLADSAGESAP
ncbi:hypothetical protein SAMN04488079_11668 [Methylophaga sulfidovorans]|uniref:Uncharacterized protein n=1 Tax=Methylophaga sulfidovorans TaxID=45496 RepID=A0A1I4AY55_9GAMM|nr:hypothetical protein SAMN04488079_11668 [Methylophaga sulfidovorans]